MEICDGGSRMVCDHGSQAFRGPIRLPQLGEDPDGIRPRSTGRRRRPGQCRRQSVEHRVTAELPGLEERDVEVLLQDGVLTVRGERKIESDNRHRGVRSTL